MEFVLSPEDRDFARRMRAFFISEIPAEIRQRRASGGEPSRHDVVTSQPILNAHGLRCRTGRSSGAAGTRCHSAAICSPRRYRAADVYVALEQARSMALLARFATGTASTLRHLTAIQAAKVRGRPGRAVPHTGGSPPGWRPGHDHGIPGRALLPAYVCDNEDLRRRRHSHAKGRCSQRTDPLA
jgi:hypothetical protein